jgi:tRNA G18 (ribose-2'-O)-methylase SpoU
LKRVEGPIFSREDLLPANIKVRITTYISEDVYRWLKAEANRTGTPYQILLNQKLRQVFDEENPNAIEARVKKLEEELKKLKSSKKAA